MCGNNSIYFEVAYDYGKICRTKVKNLECKFSKALQEVNQGLSTKLSETEPRLKVPVIDKRLKNVLRMLISKVLGQ